MCAVVNVPYLAADVVLVAIAFVGAYTSFRTARLYEGTKKSDPARTVFLFMAAAMVLIAVVTMADFVLRETYGTENIPIVRLAISISLGIIIISQIILNRWATSPEEAKAST